MKKAHWLVFACLLLFSATACVDNAYEDLGDVETDATVGGKEFAIPLGSTDTFRLKQFLPENPAGDGSGLNIADWDLPDSWTLGDLRNKSNSTIPTGSPASLAKQSSNDGIPDFSSGITPEFLKKLEDKLKEQYPNGNPDDLSLNKLKETPAGKDLFAELVDTIVDKAGDAFKFDEMFSDTIKGLGESLKDFSEFADSMELSGTIFINNNISGLNLEITVVGLDETGAPMSSEDKSKNFSIKISNKSTKKFDAIKIEAKMSANAKVLTGDKAALDNLYILIKDISISIKGGGIKLGGD